MIYQSQIPGTLMTVIACEDLGIHQLVGANGKKAAAGSIPAGICQSDVKSGKEVAVAISGVLLAYAKGAIQIGDDLATAAGGMVSKNAGSPSIGVALTQAADGDLVKLVLR